MAVHRINNNAVGKLRRLYTWNVTIGIEWQIVGKCLARLQRISVNGYFRVVFASLWILVRIIAGIDFVVLKCRLCTFEHLQRIGLNLRFVVTYPAQSLAVGTPSQGIVESELLFVHPIRQSIDYLVELTVGCYLLFSRSISYEDIVVAHKYNIFPIWREGRNLLWTTRRQFFQRLVLYII